MRTVLRTLGIAISALASFYFSFWVIGVILLPARLSPWVSIAAAFIVALAVARYVWKHTASSQSGFVRSVVLGALLTGAITFSAGFFGPILFAPSANQGPLLGIFITGPLGLILGAVGGAIYWWLRRDRSSGTGGDAA